MSKMKWFISLILSLGLLAGCEETAVKPEKKAEPKQEEQKEVAKQEEQKDVPKPEEKQAEPEQKPQEEQKDKQEQKVEEKQKEEKAQEQPEVKKEEKPKEQPAANKQPEQKVQEEKPQPPKAPEVKEEAKVVNQPKETPKQEQKEDPNKGQQVTVPVPPTPVPDPVPDPVIPKPKQVTISVKGHEGYLLGAKKVDVQEGDTVYSVLTGTGLDVDASGSKGDVYVKGIENLYEKDVNDNSGWKYRVNGSFPNRSAGVVTVKPGDTVEWVYVY
ncbi:hypothetical protein CN941_01990 [Bacillus cereus]|uniref:DUF4430 domain-containing protein n=1 Tax=Bacillus nitratireducens TaxID=2026193 RepID=UPI000BEBF339|nr:DUF4430 domain-containing protein [Bacillus nitratireducens]PEA21361.1 hypothetical protein CON40_09010 [Bacillus cereus]PEW06787.1 hypothetical protein CN428_02280 [Bacillus cereus]PEZ87865.1 hypothetical protein CN374_17610 [Bacillus cereus]PFA30925.1 hypothetical protein CN390_19945 [Bacillus cereus]PFC04218.1 hypothetical protein CN296_01105 [Bacillus cereus]